MNVNDAYSMPEKVVKRKTYNNWHSLVVTDPTTTQSVHCLTLRELTGTRTLSVLWSYVLVTMIFTYITY